MSRLMRDELLPGKEVAAYWIEHVLRHGGTKHLQLSGKDMSFYKRYLLDVFAFLCLLACTGLAVLYYFIRWIVFRYFVGTTDSKRKTQ